MGDCGLNCDFNAGVIDSWDRQTYQEKEKARKRNPNYQKMMAPIRRSHICCLCKKYPGDSEYLFGNWEKAQFTCYNCL